MSHLAVSHKGCLYDIERTTWALCLIVSCGRKKLKLSLLPSTATACSANIRRGPESRDALVIARRSKAGLASILYVLPM